MYTLQNKTRLAQQQLLLSGSANKRQLIDLIVGDLMTHKDSLSGTLIVTGSDPVPIQITHGTVSRRIDMMKIIL